MKSGICIEEGLPGRTVGKLFWQSRELLFCVCFFLAEPGLGICLLSSFLLGPSVSGPQSFQYLEDVGLGWGGQWRGTRDGAGKDRPAWSRRNLGLSSDFKAGGFSFIGMSSHGGGGEGTPGSHQASEAP